MAKASIKLGFFFLFLLTSGITEMIGVESARTRRVHHSHVNCSSDTYCDPFAKKIDWRCKYADVCAEKCNTYDGVFTCTDQPGYCLCQMEN